MALRDMPEEAQERGVVRMTYTVCHFADTSLFDLQTYALRGFELTWDYKYKFVICSRPTTMHDILAMLDEFEYPAGFEEDAR